MNCKTPYWMIFASFFFYMLNFFPREKIVDWNFQKFRIILSYSFLNSWLFGGVMVMELAPQLRGSDQKGILEKFLQQSWGFYSDFYVFFMDAFSLSSIRVNWELKINNFISFGVWLCL